MNNELSLKDETIAAINKYIFFTSLLVVHKVIAVFNLQPIDAFNAYSMICYGFLHTGLCRR